MLKVSIIGFGRFGKVLYRLLCEDFNITIYDINKETYKGFDFSHASRPTESLEDVYESDVIFYSVPISKFKETLENHKRYLKKQLLVDVLSVKEYPAEVFKGALSRSQCRAMLTHPMFGPDSSKDGFTGLPIVLDQFLSTPDEFDFWKKVFVNKGLRIVEMTAREHDIAAANSQGVAHLIGRTLGEFGIKPTEIDTLGAKKLNEIMQQTCNDSWELFENLQNYNPQTKEMRKTFNQAYEKIEAKLLKTKDLSENPKIGIQGGRGSFNHSALLQYTEAGNITNYDLIPLFTTEAVLENLASGNVDYGLFAVHNTLGGIVEESLVAMAKYKFEIVDNIELVIRHALMKLPEIQAREITRITAHPQVLAQCRKTLQDNYSNLELYSGEGKLIDTAASAEALSKGEIDQRTYILGNRLIAERYGLEIVRDGLQDSNENITRFILVSRIK